MPSVEREASRRSRACRRPDLPAQDSARRRSESRGVSGGSYFDDDYLVSSSLLYRIDVIRPPAWIVSRDPLVNEIFRQAALGPPPKPRLRDRLRAALRP